MKKNAILFAPFLLFLLFVPTCLWAQTTKTVAILEVVDKKSNVDDGVKLLVRGSLTYAISNMEGYEAFTRVDMKSIMDEQSFQRTGNVSDSQIKQLGKMTGASYVLVPEVAKFDDAFVTITAQILDVESAGVKASADPQISSIDPVKMREACIQIARTLFNKTESSSNRTTATTGSRPPQGQNFTETAGGINMRMVYVEGGTFIMGCTADQGNECDSDESPNRMTTVGSFHIGMLEVTQNQWEKIMGTSVYQQRDKANTEWPTRGIGNDYPMYYVSWEEAKEFCARLSRLTGKNYTLPTEAEWEYAARGGNKAEGTKYSGGWSIDDVAWYIGNSNQSTHTCGTKRPNALGIYDMSGNVYEWCEDWYGPYLNYDGNNPKGAATGSYRVLRGGSWYGNAGGCRVAYRGSSAPGNRYYTRGFRVVLH